MTQGLTEVEGQYPDLVLVFTKQFSKTTSPFQTILPPMEHSVIRPDLRS
jgi:hypothetical protein